MLISSRQGPSRHVAILLGSRSQGIDGRRVMRAARDPGWSVKEYAMQYTSSALAKPPCLFHSLTVNPLLISIDSEAFRRRMLTLAVLFSGGMIFSPTAQARYQLDYFRIRTATAGSVPDKPVVCRQQGDDPCAGFLLVGGQRGHRFLQIKVPEYFCREFEICTSADSVSHEGKCLGTK